MFETTILAILQGIAEFLPISSSGHLVLGKVLLGVKEPGIRLDIFLHVGTLLAIAAFYWKIIWSLIQHCIASDSRAEASRVARHTMAEATNHCIASDSRARESWSYIGKIIVSAVPAGIVGLLFRKELTEFFSSPRTVGSALIFTGIILLATKILPKGERQVSFLSAIVMGVAQAAAILPGVSRSGMTIAAAKASKVESAKAAEFSFLMSAPVIAGAALLEILEALGDDTCSCCETSWPLVIYGGVIAAIVGYFALWVLLKTLKSDKFWLFGPYCLVAGGVTLALV